jgi:mannose-1-phosphate guanylyltransferase
MKLIVTAGGQGKKIWPLSREAKPKQFQAIVGQETLYRQTILNLLLAYKPEDIFVSTKKRYFEIAKQQSPEIPTENYILEPDHQKDRGPGEGLAFLILSIKHPEEPFMIVQSDVLREPGQKFADMLIEAEKIQKRDKKFMSGGIKATHPILGIDYIRLGKRVSADANMEIYQTDEFIPRLDDYQKTKELIKSFHVATHSNHMCWYPDLMLDAYKKYRPDWYEALMKIKEVIMTDNDQEKIDQIYSQMEPGMTERVTENIVTEGYTILLPFKWTDIGTWDSIYEFFDPEGKIHSDGNVVEIDSKNSLVKNTNPNKVIAVVGVDNLIIVDTDDALLVSSKDQAQEVKKVVEILKEKDQKQYI